MFFRLRQQSNFDSKKSSLLQEIANYLELELLGNNYGQNVEVFYLVINSTNPSFTMDEIDFATGLVNFKKYTRSRRELEAQVAINFREAYHADEERFIDLLTEGILMTKGEIEAMGIKDFDVDCLYKNIADLMEEKKWLKEPEKYKDSPVDWAKLTAQKGSFSTEEKMPEDEFWNMIGEGIIGSKGSLEKEIELIIIALSKQSEKEIIGFECTLREMLIKANHWNVLALSQIVDGYITDDSFLYFRCKLILYGAYIFHRAIEDPNSISTIAIDRDSNGEPLLNVADEAFTRKFGISTDKQLPKDFASEVLSYDFGDFEMAGDPWEEKELPKKFPKLWKKYRRV
jgi:hypothetical protein